MEVKRKRIIITDEEILQVNKYRKTNKDKRIEKRLKVIVLKHQGLTNQEIADNVELSRDWVSRLCSEFKRDGLEEYVRCKYKGNHRSLSQEEEEEILSKFAEKAEKGQLVTVQDIKREFDKRIGKDTGRGYIYMLLKRHDYRKVMPRSKHPKKASEQEINCSKKLKAL